MLWFITHGWWWKEDIQIHFQSSPIERGKLGFGYLLILSYVYLIVVCTYLPVSSLSNTHEYESVVIWYEMENLIFTNLPMSSWILSRTVKTKTIDKVYIDEPFSPTILYNFLIMEGERMTETRRPIRAQSEVISRIIYIYKLYN